MHQCPCPECMPLCTQKLARLSLRVLCRRLTTQRTVPGQFPRLMDANAVSSAFTQQARPPSVHPCAHREIFTRHLRPSSVKPFVHARSHPRPQHVHRHRLTTQAMFSFGKAKAQTGLSDNCWEQAKQKPKYAPLNKDIQVDVCIVGAGMVGLTTAYRLAKAGDHF